MSHKASHLPISCLRRICTEQRCLRFGKDEGQLSTGDLGCWAGQISTAATAEGHKLEFWARNLNTANDIDLDHGNTSLPTLSLAWLNYDLSTTLWHSVDDFLKFVNKTYKIHWISTKFHRMYFATQTQLYLNNSTIFISPLRYNLVKL